MDENENNADPVPPEDDDPPPAGGGESAPAGDGDKEVVDHAGRKYRVDPEFDVVIYDDIGEDNYADGFGWMAILGGFFVGLLISPAQMFLQLMIGGGLGPVAIWVTLILFIYVARRLRTEITRQEVVLIQHVAGGVLGLAAGEFGGFIHTQYNVINSEAAKIFEIAEQIPIWVAPPPESEAYALRSLLHRDWWPHLTVMGIFLIWGRLNFYSLGYVLYRITSDIERLPFPMAPVAAEGIMALAEPEKEPWRWTCFTVGSTIGIVFGTIYVAVPVLTGLFFNHELYLIKIPFWDYTTNLQDYLPAVPARISSSLGQIFAGFVMPFWVILGSFIAAVAGQLMANPILYNVGILERWRPGMSAIETEIANGYDFWIAFNVGTALAVALLGFYTIFTSLKKRRQEGGGPRKTGIHKPPAGRGDIPILLAALMYVVATSGTIIICHVLVPKFPIWILLFFGFIYSPLLSYVSARMEGYIGRGVGIPYIRESAFLLTGYKGVDIWHAPIPISNLGAQAENFRMVELTGTKFTSLFKASIFEIVVGITCSLVFWSFIWKMGEIPSSLYPYAMRFWPLQAQQACLWWTATSSNDSLFYDVLNPTYIFSGATFGIVSYALLSVFKLPIIMVYGMIRGLSGSPFDAIPELAAALVGRYYFARRFGMVVWRRYTYVLAAGFGCGVGLAGMCAASMKLISAAISSMPY